jgi:hypothetical protein
MAEAASGSHASVTLSDVLAGSCNSDGGWGYQPGKSSRIESTAWVALARTPFSSDALRWLARTQDDDGWLRDDRRAPVNYGFNALALLAMTTAHPLPHGATALARNLLGVKGLRFDPSPVVRQDNALQAWSWVDGTLSWVEPTAYALLALKRARQRGAQMPASLAERLDVGERMLIDRACTGGGWNYGNAQVFDKQLLPHGPTTAVALLSMRDHQSVTAVRDSLVFLEQHATAERSGLALALTTICLRVYGRDARVTMDAAQTQLAVSLRLEQTVTLAALLVALDDRADAVDAFTVGAQDV